MMREILFRGKRTDTGEWIKGFYVKTCNDFDRSKFYHWIYIGFVGVTINGLENVKFEVDPETVGQYTGLKDKNGKRIFEGDIVKIGDDWDKYGWAAGEKGVIYFENGQFKLKTKVSIFVTDYAFKEGASVLGNIHDNPELLEVQE